MLRFLENNKNLTLFFKKIFEIKKSLAKTRDLKMAHPAGFELTTF